MDNIFIGNFGLGLTIDRGVKLFRTALPLILRIFAITVPCGVASGMLLDVIGRQDSVGLMLALIGLTIVLFGVDFWAFLAQNKGLLQIAETQRLPGMGELLKSVSLGSTIRYMIGTILTGLIVFASIFLLLIPFVFLSVYYPVYYVRAVHNDRYGPGEFFGSFSLQRDAWWKSFALYLILGICMAATYSIIFLPAVLMEGFVALDTAQQSLWMSFLTNLLNNTLGMLAFGLATCVTIVHYFSQRCKNEGLRVEEDIESLGQPATL